MIQVVCDADQGTGLHCGMEDARVQAPELCPASALAFETFVFLVAVAYTNSDCNKHIQVYQRKLHEMG